MLNAKAFALAAGILWGATIFITTLLAVVADFGRLWMQAYGSIHPGYSVSIGGAFIGLVYAFLCAFIGGYLLIWLYNKLPKN